MVICELEKTGLFIVNTFRAPFIYQIDQQAMKLRLLTVFAYIYCNSNLWSAEAYQYDHWYKLCHNLCVKCSPHLLGKRSVDMDSIQKSEELHLKSELESGLVLHRDTRSSWHKKWPMDSLVKRTPGSSWLNGMTKFYKEQKRDNKQIVTVRRDDWQNLCYSCRYTCGL